MAEKQIPLPEPLGISSLPTPETQKVVEKPKRQHKERRKPFKLGDVRYSPYKHPEGKLPEGTEWKCIKTHDSKNYPTYWEIVSVAPPPKIIPKKRERIAGIELSQPRGDRD